MNDIIRKAVELAHGWSFADTGFEDDDIVESLSGYRGSITATPELKDALAAQLVRQVDALDDYIVSIGNEEQPNRVVIYGPKFRLFRGKIVDGGDVDGPDRTMNTLRVIVESKVLEAEND